MTKAQEAMASSAQMMATAVQSLAQLTANATATAKSAAPAQRPALGLGAGASASAPSAEGTLTLDLGHGGGRLEAKARQLTSSGDKLRGICQRMQVMASAAQLAPF